jgi:hypothetical protein
LTDKYSRAAEAARQEERGLERAGRIGTVLQESLALGRGRHLFT